MSKDGSPAIDWEKMCVEQTPSDLRVDRAGKRAWGYKRLRLASLMNFARRNSCAVTIKAPYINLDPINTDDDEISTTSQETSFVGINAHEDDDEWDDDMDVPKSSRQRNRAISKSILQKLDGITTDRKERCISIFKTLSYIENHKVNFRLFNPRGGRAGVKLVFQITNAVITHDALKKIDTFNFVRDATLRLNLGKVLTLKIVIS